MASLKKDGREDRAALSAFTAAINSDLNDHWTEYIEASTQLKRMHAYVEKVRAGTLSFPVALDGKLDAEGKKTAKAFMTAFGGVYGNLAAEFVNQTHTAEVFSGKLSPDPASPLTAEELEEIKTKGIVIRAHTSGEANAVHNLHLSARRAIAAKLYLMAQGIPADRIKIYAFGELMPRFAEVGNKKTKDYFRELNRRIEYYFDDGSVPQFNIAPASIGGGAEAAPDVPEGTDAEDAPRDTRTPAQKAMAQANRAFQLATQAEKTLASNKPAALRLADRAIAAAQAVITANKDPDATTKADEALTKAQAAKAKAEAPAEAPVPD
ncbi:MAG: OmpA family protein [Deltaproteobacteria bacterium]|nr:OmpA family protein [Deltaproteobacteria bacterium]